MKKKKKKKKIILIVVLVLIAAGIVFGVIRHRQNKAKDQSGSDAVTMEDMTLEKTDLQKQISLSGTLASGADYNVRSSLNGVKVKSVEVKVGDTVRKGDVIAILGDKTTRKQLKDAQDALAQTIRKNAIANEGSREEYAATHKAGVTTQKRNTKDTREKKAAWQKAIADSRKYQKQLAAARKDRAAKQKTETANKKALDDAQASLTVLERQMDTLTSNLEDLAAQLEKAKAKYDAAVESGNQTDITTWKQKVDETQTAYDTTQTQYAAVKKSATQARYNVADLTTAEAASQAAYTSAKAKETTIKTKYNTAKESIKTTHEAYVTAAQTESDTKDANEKAAKEHERSQESTQMDQEESEKTAVKNVDKMQKLLDQCTVKAPASGVVTAVNVKAGDHYKGDTIATIQNTEDYKVCVSVDQYDVVDIQAGMNATVSTGTTDSDIEAQVSSVAMTPVSGGSNDSSSSEGSSTSSASYAVELTFRNSDEIRDRLRVGMTAKVTIIQQEALQVYAVSQEYLTSDEDGNDMIQVRESDGTIRDIKVETGLETDYYIEIRSDELKEGMAVVPQQSTDDGMGDGLY